MPDMKTQKDAVTSSEAALSPCVTLFIELLIEEADSSLEKSTTSSSHEKFCASRLLPRISAPMTVRKHTNENPKPLTRRTP
jgi:hypothetical protein